MFAWFVIHVQVEQIACLEGETDKMAYTPFPLNDAIRGLSATVVCCKMLDCAFGGNFRAVFPGR